MKWVALYGGSFDPIHLGHLHLIQTLLSQYDFKRFLVIPAKQNPLKKEIPGAPASDRLAMAKLAVAELGDSRVEVLDWEITQEGPNYTIDTVERLKKTESAPMAFVLGNEIFDEIPRLETPPRAPRLRRSYHRG